MQRIEHNLITGETFIIELTSDEIKDAEERSVKEQLEQSNRPEILTIEHLVNALKKANVITDAQINAEKEEQNAEIKSGR